MDIKEKIALYEFCREMLGEEYYNLTMARKEAVKALYYKTLAKEEEENYNYSNDYRIFQVNWLVHAKKVSSHL
jgi:hypothetical protein